MNKTLRRVLALLLVCLTLIGTAAVGFAASLKQVTNLKLAVRSSTQVELKWKAVSKADGYVIESFDSAKTQWIPKKETAENSIKLTKLTPGTTYSFRVKAFLESGKTRTYGEASSALPVMTKPEAVSELQMVSESSGAAKVKLRWPAAKGAASYLVFKKDATTEKKYVLVEETAKTSSTVHFSAAPGTVYFKVQSKTMNGEQALLAKCSPVLKLTLKPQVVNTLKVEKAAPTSVTLTWNPADGASAYEVYQRDERTYLYHILTMVPEPTVTVTDLEPSSTYTFAVKSVANYDGHVQRSAMGPILSVSTGFLSITGFRFSLKSNNKAVLTWDKIGSASGYEVEKSANGKSGWEKIADVKRPEADVSAKEPDGVLKTGTRYFYRVRAYANENGNVTYTSYSKVLEIHPLPETPVITRAGTAAQHGVCLEWTAAAGADGYEVQFYNADKNAWTSLVSSPMRAKVFKTYTNEDGVSTVYYLDKGLTASDIYRYRVRAFVNVGDEQMFTEFSNVYEHKYIYQPEPDTYYSNNTQKTGIGGYLYDPAEKVFFTADDPWQRNFGFNEGYDFASPEFLIQYDTVPVKFTCHEGEKWMIQPWKGQYGMLFYGGEIGIYKQYIQRDVEHYDCVNDEDQLMMEMSIYHRNAFGKWNREIHRPYGSYWWITGFKLGYTRLLSAKLTRSFRTYPDLRIEAKITMLDFDMRNAFVNAVKQTQSDLITIADYGKDDLDLYISFN